MQSLHDEKFNYFSHNDLRGFSADMSMNSELSSELFFKKNKINFCFFTLPVLRIAYQYRKFQPY